MNFKGDTHVTHVVLEILYSTYVNVQILWEDLGGYPIIMGIVKSIPCFSMNIYEDNTV